MEGQKLQNKFEIGKNIKIYILYFILIVAGIWNITGLVSETMHLLAGPAFIVLALWLFWELGAFLDFFKNPKLFKKDVYSNKLRNLVLFSLIVIAGAWFLYFIFAKTGSIFSDFPHPDPILPTIAGIPIAMGFIWLIAFIGSAAVVHYTPNIRFLIHGNLQRALLIGGVMLVFDMIMEPAAYQLGYWTWQYGVVPFWNYLVWFSFGTGFSYLALRMEVIGSSFPKLAFHTYLSLLVYFLLSYFS